jgi:hypothetical protein
MQSPKVRRRPRRRVETPAPECCAPDCSVPASAGQLHCPAHLDLRVEVAPRPGKKRCAHCRRVIHKAYERCVACGQRHRREPEQAAARGAPPRVG